MQRAIERMNGAARQAVAFAMAQIGKPYVWGAAGPSALHLLRADAGRLPQRRGLPAAGEPGAVVRRAAREPWRAGPGDLVFFAYDVRAPSTIHHVGVYIGGGAMVEAPYTGARVRTASIGRRDYIGAVRPTG